MPYQAEGRAPMHRNKLKKRKGEHLKVFKMKEIRLPGLNVYK